MNNLSSKARTSLNIILRLQMKSYRNRKMIWYCWGDYLGIFHKHLQFFWNQPIICTCIALSTSYCTMCIVMFRGVVISTHLGGRNSCIKFLILLITVSVEVPPVLSKGARAQLKSPLMTICISVRFVRLSLSLEKNVLDCCCHLGCKCCKTKTYTQF